MEEPTIARCDDPNCTCRSPELQWFTDQVLRRDANRTDYIVIPLVAGVLARSILADDSNPGTDPEGEADTRRAAEAVLALAERGRTDSWDDDLHAYGVLATLVFCHWPSLLLWGGVAYQRTTLGITFDAPADVRQSATARYLHSDPPPSWTESVLLAIGVSMLGRRKNDEMPVLGKSGRRLRVLLADRLRRQGLVSWPAILVAAVDDWSLPTVQRLALHNAAAGDAGIHYAMNVLESARNGAPADIAPAEPMHVDADASADTAAARELINATVAEIDRLRDQREAAQRDRDTIAQRDARSRSRLESLEQQLAAERQRLEALERENAELRAQRDEYAERLAADDALLAEAAPPPADTFAGRRVLFFTGVEAADSRAAMAQGFWDLGAAQVDTYWTDKTRGPDVFPPDAIVAIDVSLMGHSTSGAILDKAKIAGAWCYWGKHGSTTMARATAAAWVTHLERAGYGAA